MKMFNLVDQHEEITEKAVDAVVADSKYVTIDNFLACHDRSIKAHMPDYPECKTKRLEKPEK